MTKTPCSGCTGPGPGCDHPERWGGVATRTRPQRAQTVQAIAAVQAAMRAAQAQGGTVATMERPAPAVAPSAPLAASEAVTGRVIPPALAKSGNPGDGAEALTVMARFYGHYDYWAAPEYADLLAAWSLQCHAVEDDGSPIWRALGRLVISGMHGCGKSGTLDNIALMTGAIIPIDLTYAGIRDAIGKLRKPVIIDDAQLVFGTTGKAGGRIRKVINAHTKGRSGLDASGEISVHGQIALAGLPRLLLGKESREIEDTLSRCWVLWKERKPKGYHVPEVSDAAADIVQKKLLPPAREWCMAYREHLRARAGEFGEGAPTGLPDLGGGGRGNDQLARSLLAVCDVATALVPDEVKESRPAEEWDWSARIRRALIFVSGVPKPVEEEERPLEGVGAALDALWATEPSPAPAGGSDDLWED